MQAQIYMKQSIMPFASDTHRGKKQPKQKDEMYKNIVLKRELGNRLSFYILFLIGKEE